MNKLKRYIFYLNYRIMTDYNPVNFINVIHIIETKTISCWCKASSIIKIYYNDYLLNLHVYTYISCPDCSSKLTYKQAQFIFYDINGVLYREYNNKRKPKILPYKTDISLNIKKGKLVPRRKHKNNTTLRQSLTDFEPSLTVNLYSSDKFILFPSIIKNDTEM